MTPAVETEQQRRAREEGTRARRNEFYAVASLVVAVIADRLF